MATTGRLTADQRTAINAGAPIRQTWEMSRPNSAGGSMAPFVLFDEGIYPSPDTVKGRVIRAGSRKLQVWNPSPMVKNRPKEVSYSFTVRNDDSYWHVEHPDTRFVYNILVNGYCSPQECIVRHKLFVKLISGSWSEITHMTFEGQIKEIRYEDTGTGQGDVVGAVAIITCRQIGAWAEVSRVWTVDDGINVAMDNGTNNWEWTE